MPEHTAAQALRLVREAVANALKHAAHLRLSVTDDGRGFDPAAAPGPDTGHFGLAGTEERIQRLGGTPRIKGAPGKGATFHFQIPLSA